MRPLALKALSALPGFGLAMGVTLTLLSLVVLLPIGALLGRGAAIGPAEIAALLGRERVRAALVAALFDLVFGLALAWVLARYRFPGRLVDAAVDLPFALPTAVAGIALTALCAPNGPLGQLLAPFGLRGAYTEAGIWIALIFVGLPFVVRTVQPVIEEIDREVEEASATLGASRARTFVRVILPMLVPALLTGFALSLARAVGEYGSVIFIAGNLPIQTEIAPLLIIIRLEEFDYYGAVAIALAMLGISFALLLAINLLQIWSRRRMGAV
ncbi:sulfate ABC transporter permease subunit CysT [Cereibacter azotoformans]|uniref:sulfate ABC transporter permease subunit CysT n=1 Tax=Cereibacter azotoformans TaxID=43057 RepID=UPI000C6D9A97|nr:sulfate ABC transporter permease subunit CysT [Cereibacter azotoformans]